MSEQLPERVPDRHTEPKSKSGQPVPVVMQSQNLGCFTMIWRIVLALLVTTGCLVTVLVIAGLMGVGAIGDFFGSLFSGPPPPAILPTNTVLTLVQREAILQTARYNFEKVVPVEFAQHLGGIAGEKLLYIGVGYVEAGIDLTGITEDDIIVDEEKNVTIRLPPAYLTDCVLNARQSYIYQHDTGLVNFLYQVLYEEPNLLELAEEYAIIAFRDSALESDILEMASEEAKAQLHSILLAAGMRSVTFEMQEGIEPQHSDTCIFVAPTPVQ